MAGRWDGLVLWTLTDLPWPLQFLLILSAGFPPFPSLSIFSLLPLLFSFFPLSFDLPPQLVFIHVCISEVFCVFNQKKTLICFQIPHVTLREGVLVLSKVQPGPHFTPPLPGMGHHRKAPASADSMVELKAMASETLQQAG